jgi:hypothetical protein
MRFNCQRQLNISCHSVRTLLYLSRSDITLKVSGALSFNSSVEHHTNRCSSRFPWSLRSKELLTLRKHRYDMAI